MARFSTAIAVNTSGTGDIAGFSYTSYTTTQWNSSAMAATYSYYGTPVFSATIKGSFTLTSYSASGTITEIDYFSATGSPIVLFESLNINFSSVYDLSSKISNDSIFAGSDQMIGSDSDDVLYARGGNDTVYGFGGNDGISGGDGDDDMNGNLGNDTVDGGVGNDFVAGGKNDDSLAGGVGNDTVNGNMGNDVVYGNDGNDCVYGAKDDDVVYGQAGSDLVSGDLGNDTLWGGSGADLFNIAAGFGNDVAADFSYAEGDRIRYTAGLSYSVGTDGSDALVSFGSDTTLRILGAAGQVTTDWFVAA